MNEIWGMLMQRAIHASVALVLWLSTGIARAPVSLERGQQKTLRKSTGVLVGSATKRVEPEYPAKARQAGISGKVVVQVTIDEKGQVILASPVSGPEVLRQAAVRAARRWTFSPTYLSGLAVRVVGEISFNFEFDVDVASRSNGSSEPRGRTVSANSPMLLLSAGQRQGLNKRLDLATPTQMGISNEDGALLWVASATIWSSRLNAALGPNGSARSYPRDDYAMKAEVVLINRSDQRLVSAGLQFANTLTGEVFYCYPNELTVGAGRRGRFRIPLMLLTGDPSHFAVQAVGAFFGDYSIWGSYPYPPPLKAGTRTQLPSAIDSAPELISSIHPTYTDEARRNRVRGAVRLGLEIGPDGAVRGLEVLNALPDGLTDEAVRIARRLSFRPATRSGEPVPCQISLDIEFRGG